MRTRKKTIPPGYGIPAEEWLKRHQKPKAVQAKKKRELFTEAKAAFPWEIASLEEKAARLDEFIRILMREGNAGNITIPKADDLVLQSIRGKVDAGRYSTITKDEIKTLARYYRIAVATSVSLPQITFRAKK